MNLQAVGFITRDPVKDGRTVISTVTATRRHALDNNPLSPVPGPRILGRSAFLIHGGSEAGEPSQGWVILPKAIRDRINNILAWDKNFVVFDGGASGTPPRPRCTPGLPSIESVLRAF